MSDIFFRIFIIRVIKSGFDLGIVKKTPYFGITFEFSGPFCKEPFGLLYSLIFIG